MEAHSTTSAEQEGASHSLVGYNVHPNCKGRGRCAIVVELDGRSGLSMSAEQLSGSEPTAHSGRCGIGCKTRQQRPWRPFDQRLLDG